MECRNYSGPFYLTSAARQGTKTVGAMISWRMPWLFPVLLFFAQPARSAPPDAPAENLSIAPRPVPEQPKPGQDKTAAGGLSLDDAVNRLVAFNLDLRAKYQDIPKARADELTASLRNAPAIFLSGNQLPYGRYSPQRPGTPNYEISPVDNVDYSGKRRSHMREARWATREIEARYQNAVRLEIDHLYDAYVDVLESREAVQAARTDLRQFAKMAAMSREGSRTDADRIALQRFNAEAAVREAEVELAQRKRNLAVLLAIPPDKAGELEINGSLDEHSGPPPPVEELIHLALESRPDLAAQRLGSERDRALVQVTQAERFDDAAVFVSPYEVQNNSPQGKKSSSGWGGGALFAVPILDRNQGVIARARINLRQGQIEVEGMERVAVNEVRHAWTEYSASREVVQQYEHEGLPAARHVLKEEERQYLEGKQGIDALLEARKEYSEMVRLYREAQVHHRRSMLKLNTAVGKRILP